MSPARRDDAIMAALGLVVILLDQLTKHLVVAYFGAPNARPPIPIVGNVLEIMYLQNNGVAFSLLSGQSVLFVFIAVAVCVIGWLYWRLRDSGGLAIKATFGLILGGAVGNLIDRFAHTYVVDFIHFQIQGVFDFAVFNVADSAITVGVIALAYLLWRSAPHEEPASATSEAHTAPDPAAPPRSAPLPRVRNPNARPR